MKKKQEIPLVKKDTQDIIKALKPLDLLQKKDILATIVAVKTKSSD